MNRREQLDDAYKTGVQDVLEVLIETKPDPENWQTLIKETGKAFGVDIKSFKEDL